MNGFKLRLKAMWNVLISDNFLVCTTKVNNKNVNFYHGYSHNKEETLASTIIKVMVDRMKEVNTAIVNYKKEQDKSKT